MSSRWNEAVDLDVEKKIRRVNRMRLKDAKERVPTWPRWVVLVYRGYLVKQLAVVDALLKERA